MALVFCGHRDRLIDLAGEPTAKTLYKFILTDTRLGNAEDFARADGTGLPEWPTSRIEPVDGVCFVFARGDEAALQRLREQHAVEGEHYIIVDDVNVGERPGSGDRFASFAQSLAPDSRIAIIGYGQQGSMLVGVLRENFGVAADRLMIVDDNPESQRRATDDGLNVFATSSDFGLPDAVIYTPLSIYEQLWRFVDLATQRGASCFDNSHRASGLKQFVTHGRFHLDAAAARALRVEVDRFSPKEHGLAVPCILMRADVRQFGIVQLPHLHANPPSVLSSSGACIDLNTPGNCDGLDLATWIQTERAYVSLRPGPELGFFAARDLCERLWVAATDAIFPSRHVIDLGATAFERLLRAHHDGREVVTTMQTPAQRVTLGVVARHYAEDRPIIEVGSALGGSALLMAAATNHCHPPIYSIDPDSPTRDIMRFVFQREGYLDRLTQIVEPSDRAIARLSRLRRRVGLVFIDGLHTQAGVLSDFKLYAPLLAAGGALVFHDVVPALHGVFSTVMNCVMHDHRFEAKCMVEGLMVFERCA